MSSAPGLRIATTWSPGRITVSPTAISATPLRITETRREPSGSDKPGDALTCGRRVGLHLHLDDLEPFAAQLEQADEAVLGHLVLDEREQAGRRAHRLGDPEQVEVLLVPRVVDAGDRLRDAVALLGDLGDDQVVLVVARHRQHELRRPRDPGALENGDLGRVAEHRGVAELGLELARSGRGAAR